MLVGAVQPLSDHRIPPDGLIMYCLVREPHLCDVYTLASLWSRTCGRMWPFAHPFISVHDPRRSASKFRHRVHEITVSA